jgi:hypothetical protein
MFGTHEADFCNIQALFSCPVIPSHLTFGKQSYHLCCPVNHIVIGATRSLFRSAESCRVERLVRFAFFVCWLMSIVPSVPSSFHFHTIVVLSYFGFVEDYYLSRHCPFTCLMYVRASHVDIIFRSQAAFSCSVLPMKSSLMTQAYIFVYCGAVIPWFCWTLLFIQALSIHLPYVCSGITCGYHLQEPGCV